MPLKIEIPESDLQYLSQHARLDFSTYIKKYGDQLLQEAGRLEAIKNPDGACPEITSLHIHHAALYLNHYNQPRKKPWWFIILQILASITALITGGLFDLEKLQSLSFLLPFVILLVLTIILTTLQVFIGRSL